MGYEARELVGQNLFDFMHPDDRTASRNVIDRAMREGRFEAFECRLRSKDGSYIWAEANSELVLLGGKLVQINGVARDITERKQAEEALRLSEEKYRKIVNNIQDIIYSYQPDGTLTFVSESVRRMGYEPQELVDHSIFGFLHPDDLPHVMRSFENAVLHNLHEHVECRLTDQGGRLCLVRGEQRAHLPGRDPAPGQCHRQGYLGAQGGGDGPEGKRGEIPLAGGAAERRHPGE